MADLLSSAEFAQLQQGFLDAMNTLHRSPISLFVKELSLDIRQINTEVTYTEYELNTIVKEKNKQNLEGVEGSRDVDQIETKFHRQDFIDLGLISTEGELLFNSAESYFVYLGKKLRLVSVVQEDIAVRIEAEPYAKVILDSTQTVTDYSLDLSGGTKFIYSPVTPVYDFEYNSQFTLSLWIKLTSLSATVAMINHYDTGIGRGYFVTINTDGSLRCDLRNSGANILSITSQTSLVNVGSWVHIVITYGGTSSIASLNVFVNSVVVTKMSTISTLGNNTISTPTTPILIGVTQTSTLPLEGFVFAPRIWNIALTQTDITDEYNGKGIITPVESGNLIGQPDINNAVYNVNSFDMPDLSGTVAEFKTVNIPITGRSLDIPT